MRGSWMGFVGLVGAFGCAKTRLAETPADLSTLHMVAVVDAVDAARLAVIAGHPATAQRHLSWLAEDAFDPKAIDRSLRRHAERLIANAREGSRTSDLSALGRATAEVGAACGACHEAVGRGPQFAEAAVAAGRHIRAHMLRHQWGVDSLWEGLVTPHEAMWQAGARSFFEVPVDPEFDPVIPPELSPLAERVHDLGTECLSLVDRRSKAEQYGALIATCGECHQLLGGPPGPLAQ